MTVKTILRNIKRWAKESYEYGQYVDNINEFEDYLHEDYNFDEVIDLIKPLCHENQTPVQYCWNYYCECFEDARE